MGTNVDYIVIQLFRIDPLIKSCQLKVYIKRIYKKHSTGERLENISAHVNPLLAGVYIQPHFLDSPFPSTTTSCPSVL